MQENRPGEGYGRGRKNIRGMGFGPWGQCLCSYCGTAVSHKAGIPCQVTKYPKFGSMMMRDGQ